jgi:leucyl-tRNA synthetase
MVISDGRKMSKHLGNVVNPDELVDRFGADTLRLAVLYAARPQRSLNWSDSAVLRCHRFLTSVWDYCHAHAEDASPALAGATPGDGATRGEAGEDAGRDATEHLRQRLSKWSQTAVQRTTQDMEGLEMHSAVRNVMRMFDRIRDFEKRVRARQGELSAPDHAALLEALSLLCQLLAPLAPHIAEELWITLGNEAPAAQTPWPGVSFQVPA